MGTTTIRGTHRTAIAALVVGLLLSLTATPARAATPPIWEADLGDVVIASADDATAVVALGFDFPFAGTVHDTVEVSSNGFLALPPAGSPDCCDGTPAQLLNDGGRIAPAWYDLTTGEGDVRANTFPGRAVITWNMTPEFSNPGLPNLFQVQLFEDGRIVFGYDTLHADIEEDGHRHHAIVGVSPGDGGADPGEVDFSAVTSLDTGSEPTVYEFFERGPNGATGPDPDPFDLETSNICLTPNGSGGWTVGCQVERGVEVDVRPGTETAPVNLRSRGVIPVAVLTTSGFDATSVDVATACFGDAEDPAQRACAEAHSTGHVEDVDGDGDDDLVLHFPTQETGIDPGDTEACLTATTTSGDAVTGCDAIRVR